MSTPHRWRIVYKSEYRLTFSRAILVPVVLNHVHLKALSQEPTDDRENNDLFRLIMVPPFYIDSCDMCIHSWIAPIRLPWCVIFAPSCLSCSLILGYPDQYDPIHCNALLSSGSWLDSGYRNWQPDGKSFLLFHSRKLRSRDRMHAPLIPIERCLSLPCISSRGLCRRLNDTSTLLSFYTHRRPFAPQRSSG